MKKKMTDLVELRAAVGRLMYSNQKSSADYDMIINFIEKATELINVAAKCMDDCDYAMTKVSNSRVEEAVSTWNAAYNHFKGGAENA